MTWDEHYARSMRATDRASGLMGLAVLVAWVALLLWVGGAFA
jgi:uncharacterized membrane protein